MKRFSVIILVSSVLIFSCQKTDSQAVNDKGSKADVSYAFGMVIGESLKNFKVELDYQAFAKAVQAVVENQELKFSYDEANMMIQMVIIEAMDSLGAENLAKEQAFLAENAKKTGVITTASGLQYEIIKLGSGDRPKASDIVKVHYAGSLLDGTKFDSSYDRGEAAIFPVNGVIPGWTEALQLMPVGSSYKLFIPAALAYGEYGTGGDIGPNATLIFTVDLLSIENSLD